jgi:hypothetical protein
MRPDRILELMMINVLFKPAAACLAATLLVTAAEAQQAAPGAAPGAGSAATANPTPSHLAAARELTSMTGVSGLFDAFLPQFGAQIKARTVTRPELGKDLDQVLDGLKPELEAQKQTMVDAAARLYARAFTEAELKDLVAYYKTPTGQKYLQLAPRLLDELSVDTQRWTERVSEFVMTRVRAEMAKRGHQI